MHAICNTPVLHAIYRVLRTRNLHTYMYTVAMSITLVTTASTYLWFPLYKSGCCTETFIVFKELAGYITLYSEVDYFLSGFKEASGL